MEISGIHTLVKRFSNLETERYLIKDIFKSEQYNTSMNIGLTLFGSYAVALIN